MMASTWQDVLNKTSGCVRDWHRACFQHSLANSQSVACAALAVSLWLGEPMPLPLPMRMASWWHLVSRMPPSAVSAPRRSTSALQPG